MVVDDEFVIRVAVLFGMEGILLYCVWQRAWCRSDASTHDARAILLLNMTKLR